jgi:hypothetical protein
VAPSAATELTAGQSLVHQAVHAASRAMADREIAELECCLHCGGSLRVRQLSADVMAIVNQRIDEPQPESRPAATSAVGGRIGRPQGSPRPQRRTTIVCERKPPPGIRTIEAPHHHRRNRLAQ